MNGCVVGFHYNVMVVINVNLFYLVVVPDTTSEFLPGDVEDLLKIRHENTRNRRE